MLIGILAYVNKKIIAINIQLINIIAKLNDLGAPSFGIDIASSIPQELN
jgi:hypothetical protein